MDVPSVLPSLPPTPPNFASSPLELVQSTGLNVVVESVLPTLRVSIVTELGCIPFYFDALPQRSQGRYDEF
jgi:hypothetical protein